MEALSLGGLAEAHLGEAVPAPSGRSAATVFGGADHVLRQTMIAMRAGAALAEHESPGEATLQVLRGRVRLTAGTAAVEGVPVTCWSSRLHGTLWRRWSHRCYSSPSASGSR